MNKSSEGEIVLFCWQMDGIWSALVWFLRVHTCLWGGSDKGAPRWTADVGDARSLCQPLSVVQ